MLGALALWFVDLSWLSFFVIAGLEAIWQVGLARIAPGGTDDADDADEAADAESSADESVTVGGPASAEEADGGSDPVDNG